jgi:leucine efflux protein
MLIKYAGAAYLAWIGLGLLRTAVARWRGVAERAAEDLPTDAGKPFHKALLISLMNPKAILFFISFFIQFVDPHYAHPALSFLILGVIVQILSAIYLSTLIFGGARLAQKFRSHRRVSALATAFVGIVFIGFCFKLASASLS